MSTVAPKRREPDPLRIVLDTVRGLPAAPLPEPVRHDVEARTGADLSTVRVHYTAEAGRYAAALGATAFTFGRDVVVGADAGPDTLRHEAVHAAQFARHGTPAAPRGIAGPAHPAHREADAVGATGLGGASPGGLIQRQETPAEKKKAPTTFSGELYRGLLATPAGAALAVVAPPELRILAGAGAAGNAFAEAFVATVVESLTEADAKRLKDEFSRPAAVLQYMVGTQVGIVAGVAIDVYENLKGLYEIAKLLAEYSPIGMAAKSLADVAMYAYDPDTYLMVKREEAAHAKQVIAAVLSFVQKVATDPTFLLGQAETMGAACGDMVSEWFHDDFLLKQSSFDKGYTVGKGLGIAATEIALLFLGPEEWVARGVVAAGRIAKGSKLYRAVVQILEKVPEMARLFKVKKELDEANNALKAAKKVEQVGEAAAEAAKAEKALAAAGDVPKDVPVPKTHAPEPKAVHPPEPAPDPIKPKEKAAPPTDAVKVEKPAKPKPKPEPKRPNKPESPAAAEANPTKPAKAKPAKTKPAEQPKVKANEAKPAKQKKSNTKERTRPKEPAPPVQPTSVRDGLPPHATPAHEARLAKLLDSAEDAGIFVEGRQLDALLSRLSATRDARALDRELGRLEAELDRAKDVKGLINDSQRLADRPGTGRASKEPPEGTHASGTTTKPRTAVQSDAEMLAANMTKAMEARPPGHEAHHIVPKGMKEGEEAREILREANIGINDAENGIWLPADESIPNVSTSEIHSKVHTDRAIRFITDELREGAKDGPEGVRRALQKIRENLSDLRFER